jgi:hypothetical protein
MRDGSEVGFGGGGGGTELGRIDAHAELSSRVNALSGKNAITVGKARPSERPICERNVSTGPRRKGDGLSFAMGRTCVVRSGGDSFMRRWRSHVHG